METTNRSIVYEDEHVGIVEEECEHFPNQLTEIDTYECKDMIVKESRCECGRIITETFKLMDTLVHED